LPYIALWFFVFAKNAAVLSLVRAFFLRAKNASAGARLHATSGAGRAVLG
jgi:hypothetical protein